MRVRVPAMLAAYSCRVSRRIARSPRRTAFPLPVRCIDPVRDRHDDRNRLCLCAQRSRSCAPTTSSYDRGQRYAYRLGPPGDTRQLAVLIASSGRLVRYAVLPDPDAR